MKKLYSKDGASMTIYNPEATKVAVDSYWSGSPQVFWEEPIQRAVRIAIRWYQGWGKEAHAAFRHVSEDHPGRTAVQEVMAHFPFTGERENCLFAPGFLGDQKKRIAEGNLGALHLLLFATTDEDRAPLIAALLRSVGMEPHPENPTVCIRTVRCVYEGGQWTSVRLEET